MSDGIKISANDFKGLEFVTKFNEIGEKIRVDERLMADKLRLQGVKAWHTNDGWNDKEKRKIHMAYPYFNDGVNVGDKIAIGDSEPNIFTVKDIKYNILAIPRDSMPYYFY